MRGLIARWTFRTVGSPEAPAAQTGTLVERVLAARGLANPDVAGAFLSPKLLQLHDPSLIPDLDRAAARMLAALERAEPIVIYGDYDVDGVTATAILFHALRAIRPDADVRTYVPHRIDEGYGLNSEAIAQLAAEGARLIVSVDCGVTATGPALEARRHRVDLIITDHHNPPDHVEELPEAAAVVHPRRPDSAYPFEHLCGAGVAFKLAWRLATMHAGSARVPTPMRTLLLDLLAFAALGAIADVVPLVGENRVMARFGLRRIKQSDVAHERSSCLRGLHALVAASGLDSDSIDSYDAGFRLAPRLNASGRMGHAREAVELFTTADDARAAELSARLTQLNNQRREVERKIFDEAARMAEEAGMTREDRRAIVLADEQWHPGVVGIVCSRLVERFSRPAILMQRRDGKCHGSGRSVGGFNLHGALASCGSLLDRFGGHDMAAGLVVPESNLGAFVESFTELANGAISPEDLTPSLMIDCEAKPGELTVPAVAQLLALEPFGRSNPSVQIVMRNVTLASPPQFLGGQGRHLALVVREESEKRIRTLIRVVAWHWGERFEQLPPGVPMDLVVEPRLSGYNGRASVEPQLLDVRVRGKG